MLCVKCWDTNSTGFFITLHSDANFGRFPPFFEPKMEYVMIVFPQIKISSQVTALHWRTCGTTLRPLWPAQHRLDFFSAFHWLDNLNPGKSRKFRYPKELPWGYSSFSVAPKMQTMEMFCWRKPVSFFADHRNNWPFAGTFGARMLCIEECHTTASLAIDDFNQIVLKSHHHHHLKQVWTYLSNLYILFKKILCETISPVS